MYRLYIFANSMYRETAERFIRRLSKHYDVSYIAFKNIYPKSHLYRQCIFRVEKKTLLNKDMEDIVINYINENYLLGYIRSSYISMLSDDVLGVYIGDVPEVVPRDINLVLHRTLRFFTKLYDYEYYYAPHLTKKYFYIDYYLSIADFCRNFNLEVIKRLDELDRELYRAFTGKNIEDTEVYKLLTGFYYRPLCENNAYVGLFADLPHSYATDLYELQEEFKGDFRATIVSAFNTSCITPPLKFKAYDFMKICYNLYNRYSEYVYYYSPYGILFGFRVSPPVDDRLLQYASALLIRTVIDFDVNILEAFKIFYKFSQSYAGIYPPEWSDDYDIETIPVGLFDAYDSAVVNMKKGSKLNSAMLRAIAGRIAECLKKEKTRWRGV